MSLFTDRAISHDWTSVLIMRSVALSAFNAWCGPIWALLAMFTIDTETGFNDIVLINASYGLGENVVQGSVSLDEFSVSPTLKQDSAPSCKSDCIQGVQAGFMIPVAEEWSETSSRRQRIAAAFRSRMMKSLLARWACVIEEHYSARHGHPTPMDIEWAKDGQTGEIFIVQARPETVQSRRNLQESKAYKLAQRGKVLLKGRAAGEAVACGPVRVVASVTHQRVQPGDILSPTRPIPIGSR